MRPKQQEFLQDISLYIGITPRLSLRTSIGHCHVDKFCGILQETPFACSLEGANEIKNLHDLMVSFPSMIFICLPFKNFTAKFDDV